METTVISVPFVTVHQHNDDHVEIYRWCTKQFGTNGEGWWFSHIRKEYDFYRSEDAMLFLLRWS